MTDLSGRAADVSMWDARGRVLAAGFWNCHVHFSEPVWAGAPRAPARRHAAHDRSGLDAGGRVLFGTDVGYLRDYDIAGELGALARCGVDGHSILRSLTTAPAAAFGRGDQARVAPGMAADLTVLATCDPQVTAKDFGRVAAVVKAGRLIHPAE